MDRFKNQYIKNFKIAFSESVLLNIGNLVLMYLGAIMVIAGEITLGSLMVSTSLLCYFMGPIGKMINLQLNIDQERISLKRISQKYEVEKVQEEDDKIKIN